MDIIFAVSDLRVSTFKTYIPIIMRIIITCVCYHKQLQGFTTSSASIPTICGHGQAPTHTLLLFSIIHAAGEQVLFQHHDTSRMSLVSTMVNGAYQISI